jgi:2-phosphosulfolactate phosphatase
MKIYERYGVSQAPECEGHVIVIDVLRAFTTAAYAFAQGTEKILLVGTPKEAFEIKRCNPDYLLVGENGGRKIEGFDYGNSPETIWQLNLENKTLILRSSSGTQGVVNARNTKQIYLGSLVVAQSTCNYLTQKFADPVTILAMESVGPEETNEDIACRDYMVGLLKNTPHSKETIRDRVIQSPAAQQALDPKIDYKTPGDLECALQFNKFNFIMQVQNENGWLVARPLTVSPTL